MPESFQLLREIISGQHREPIRPGDFSEPSQARLIAALTPGTKRPPGPSDLACLVRHVLRTEAERQGSNPILRVPRRPPWTDRSGWRRSGFDVLDEAPDAFVLQSQPWNPDWLPHHEGASFDRDAFRGADRRAYSEAPADPLLSLVGRNNYRSVGQRAAIRGVLSAPPGATLVVNLPTGSGKSLCAQLPALLLGRSGGLTVVVVPTTALAIDQERAIRQYVEHPTAYYGNQSATARERRAGIRGRIVNGTQQIVFTSPESLMESLAGPLYEAAEHGLLRLFVIDEAHMVEQWGDDFRSAFQEIPGLRRVLLRIQASCPFLTLLMTATLTTSCLDTLEMLYGGGPFDIVSAAQLRPEPSYWFSKCSEEIERHERVIEAAFHLPRPLLVYTTRRDQAESLGNDLRDVGFQRLEVVTGDSSSGHRERVIDEWRNRDLDIVVATSAFGLGVDQAEVRAVVHACIPETIDRFYQEVGRGGRDGKACLSLTLYTRSDVGTAKDLSETVLIKVEKGLKRWQRMFNAKEALDGGRYRVPVDITPGTGPGELNMDNKLNREWNVRTLTLMGRAGLIEIDSEPPPKGREESGDRDTSALISAYRDSRVIRILNEDHRLPKVWEAMTERVRKRRKEEGNQSLALMRQALKDSNHCISTLFAKAYKIPERTTPTHRIGASVSLACGGCPACRMRGAQPFSATMLRPLPAWRGMPFFVGAELTRMLEGERLLAVFYDSARRSFDWEERFDGLLAWFVRQGIRNVIGPPTVLARLGATLPKALDSVAYLAEQFEPLWMPPLPVMLVTDETSTIPGQFLRIAETSPTRVLVTAYDAVDPNNPSRRLSPNFQGRNFDFEELLSTIAL